MTILKRINNIKKLFYFAFLLLGIGIGLLAARGFQRGVEGQKPDAVKTNIDIPTADIPAGTNADTNETNALESAGTDQIVDYPFSYSQEGWQLILHEETVENESDQLHNKREFRLYNEKGQLVQSFSCGLDAEDLIFQFDRLFHYYGYDEDLIVFPADADETGAKGLCYPWDDETGKFSEEAVVIPWYQELSGMHSIFLTSETKGDTVINTICVINEESRNIVELRKWSLARDERDGREILRIQDCLSGQDLYWDEVERDALGNLVNDKYYQYLFEKDLPHLWNWKNDTEIDTAKVTQGRYEHVTYPNREKFLADYGFQDKDPFYEYYDDFHRLELEVFFDEQTGQSCAIEYGYRYNYALEQTIQCWGFAFDQVTREKWASEDVFSTLSVDGTDARKNNVSGYREIYEYTDDGKLSSYEARGTVVDYGEGGERGEDSLLSMDYVYRNDGTLYHKEYDHHHILFGSTHMGQSSDFDEQGRIVYKYSYITHGSISYYYIYKGDNQKPAFCLMLDLHGTCGLISYGK